MSYAEMIEALVKRCEALEAIIAEYCPGCDPDGLPQMHSSQCDDVDHAPQLPLDLATTAQLARWAEIGERIEKQCGRIYYNPHAQTDVVCTLPKEHRADNADDYAGEAEGDCWHDNQAALEPQEPPL